MRVVLVHGAWHDAWSWHLVGRRLTELGVDWVAPELPLSSYADDIATVRAVIDRDDHPVVLVGHSRGGVVVTCASSGRANVKHLVYVAAPMMAAGEIKLAHRRPTLREISVRSVGDTYVVDPDLAPALLYADCGPDLARQAIARLRPTAQQQAHDIAGYAAGWRTIPSTYVVCSEDQCVHPDDQRLMAANATHVVELAAGHSAPLSRPVDLADLLADRAGRLSSPLSSEATAR